MKKLQAARVSKQCRLTCYWIFMAIIKQWILPYPPLMGSLFIKPLQSSIPLARTFPSGNKLIDISTQPPSTRLGDMFLCVAELPSVASALSADVYAKSAREGITNIHRIFEQSVSNKSTVLSYHLFWVYSTLSLLCVHPSYSSISSHSHEFHRLDKAGTYLSRNSVKWNYGL
jgi:hypothetical protein